MLNPFLDFIAAMFWFVVASNGKKAVLKIVAPTIAIKVVFGDRSFAFEATTNQKRYEYYRELLLSF